MIDIKVAGRKKGLLEEKKAKTAVLGDGDV